MSAINTIDNGQSKASTGSVHPLSASMPVAAKNISFELFPPNDLGKAEQFWSCAKRLGDLQPNYLSVTCGAGGSSRERTIGVIERLQEDSSSNFAPHITCIGARRGEIRELAQHYWQMGVRNVVALRGDLPADTSAMPPRRERFEYASELVAELKKVADFNVAVAAYPEVHPEAASARSDLDNLKRKFVAGADRAITQFFFETERFVRFRDACHAYGIEQEIVPGILPITQFAQLKNFAGRCGTSVPSWLDQRFAGLDQDPQTRSLVAASVAIDQVRELYAQGVRHFHFYTLNRAELSVAICHTLGVREATVQSPRVSA